jgi:hypothetical protein
VTARAAAWLALAALAQIAACGGGDPARDAAARAVASYGDAVARGDLDAAWSEASSARRRREVPRFVYEAAQARLRDELGPLRRVELTREPVQALEEADRGAFVRAFARWEGTLGTAYVAIDVVDEGGAYHVDRTWSWPPDGVGTLRTF